jgi:hypothetical protein
MSTSDGQGDVRESTEMTLREPMPFEEERELFFCELGRALAEWAAVEANMMNLVAHCFPSDARPQFGMGFVKLPGFNAKLLYADGVLTRTIGKKTPFGIRWGELLQKLREQSLVRNDLAHWQVEEYPNHNVQGQRIALRPWIITKGFDFSHPPGDALWLMKVQTARLLFEAHQVMIQNYLADALGRPAPFPKSDELARNPQTIRELRLQMHAALGHPHQSLRQKRLDESARNAEASLRIAIPIGGTDGTQIPPTIDASGGQSASEDVGNTAHATQSAPGEAEEKTR